MKDDMIDKDEKIILNAEQEAALGVMMSGANVFLRGEAGTGRSTLVREFLRRCDRECVVLAPTGIAALNAGGTKRKFIRDSLFSTFFAYPLALGGGILVYYAPVRPQRRTSILENRKLEIKENCNVYRDARRKNLAKRIRAHDGCLGIGRR